MTDLTIKGQKLSETVYVLRWNHALFGLENSVSFKRESVHFEDQFLKAVFALHGLEQITLSATEMRIKAQSTQSMSSIVTAIANLLRQYQPSKLLLPQSCQTASVKTEENQETDAIKNKIENLFNQQVRPALAAHGGNVTLVAFESGELQLRFDGGCQGCSQISATLRGGIETLIKKNIPEVSSIVDITNHQAGEKPYFD